MQIHHDLPRRLQVSALAAMANPSSQRLDNWHLLDDATQQLAAVHRGGLDYTKERERVRRLLERLGSYERFWLYPGPKALEELTGLLNTMDTAWLSRKTSLYVRLLAEYGDRAALFDPDRNLEDQELAARAANQQFFTVLLADDSPVTAPEGLAGALRALRRPDDPVIYEILVVPSVEDAITAAALNGEIQAAIIRHDLPLRSRDRLPIMSYLLGPSPTAVATDRTYDWVECGQWLSELRPTIDLYLLTDESFVVSHDEVGNRYDRTFYRLNDVTDLHSTVLHGIRERYTAPFFDALREYAASPMGQFHALPVARGASIFNSRTLRDMGTFYGRNIFMAETSSTSGGLDSLLAPHGTLRQAMDKAAKTFNSDSSYFVTNGTSTANKIVVQSLTNPGAIVLIDRNCHKSHHYGLVLAGAQPVYLDAYPLEKYAFYGAVPLVRIKEALLTLEAEGRLDQVKMLLLTNCTFDGVVYNPMRVMEEVLAIKPDICFLWDEAWFAYAAAVPWMRQRTAMVTAQRLEEKLSSAEYAEQYRLWKESMEGVPRSEWLNRRLLPDPRNARVRVYATHSTHKSLSALRQSSMIHVRDQDFNRLVAEPFEEAFLTHTSTSPNQQLLASLDLARRQVDIEGFDMVRRAYMMAMAFRQRVATDPLISKWFSIVTESELVPPDYRESMRPGPGRPPTQMGRWNLALQHDEFVLDPTRVTLFVGRTGMSGYDFREKILMREFGIQINKTSINSVLLIFTIGVTWSSVHFLLDALRRACEQFEHERQAASRAEHALIDARVQRLTGDLPALPDFSSFDPAFQVGHNSHDGDIRKAFYAGNVEADREYVPLSEAAAGPRDGRRLVSTTFVVPYPPGFPVLVPGQAISPEIVDFLLGVDVHEIHGYQPNLGLSVFTEESLVRREANPSMR
ncbi:aminotransferase class I/II-fold pyridoxal phosphate-dependent enzyme [Piscicoccus intestinalis]|uniref:aminotransferase class I/II-fold pyridoxal phosphate-dependent enzyme n=1 Tax=Piscicoccus intestinalis TaxID=746033 RepID=UPI000837C7E1|nr:aminotransferase class I/II-fold pyridoxal phosphate-dependent enzyme [Piscicoccus intestinalis]